jgi:hypothetical protein
MLMEIEQAVGFVGWRRLIKTTRFLGAALVRAARTLTVNGLRLETFSPIFLKNFRLSLPQ